MTKQKFYQLLTFFIALVWLLNGLFCKVLHLVPRHQIIVQNILQVNENWANRLTILIGFSEIIMAIWIVSKIETRVNSITQMVLIAIMNSIEFIVAPNLLLWGRFNSLFALLLISIIYYNEFILRKSINNKR
jgi:hypothetical protein